MLVFAGCDKCRDGSSCLPSGTYVDADLALGVASARICLDDDCRVLHSGEGIGNVQNGFYRDEWTDGRRLTVIIEAYDASGALIDSISEIRTMNSDGCACGVLFYGWRNGSLYRIN